MAQHTGDGYYFAAYIWLVNAAGIGLALVEIEISRSRLNFLPDTMALLTASTPRSTRRSRQAATGADTPSSRARSKAPTKSPKTKSPKSKLVTWAPPSLLLFLCWTATLLVALYFLPSLSPSPPTPPPAPVQLMRGCFLLLIITAEVREIMLPVKLEETHYMPESKLRPATVDTSGLKNLGFFTHWSWCALGLYFAATFYDPTTQMASAILFTVAAPNALLVSVIVTFVIWPGLLVKSANTDGLKVWTVVSVARKASDKR